MDGLRRLSLSGLDPARRVDRARYGAADVPEHPARVLLAHLAWKCAQGGAVLGCLATPLVALTRGAGWGAAWRTSLLWGTLSATAGTAGLTAQRLLTGGLGDEGVDDRAYRLSQSASQLHVDRYSLVGACGGAALGSIAGRLAWRSVLPWALAGVAAGVAAHTVETLVLPELDKQRVAAVAPPAEESAGGESAGARDSGQK